jgi:hypothetical protein
MVFTYTGKMPPPHPPIRVEEVFIVYSYVIKGRYVVFKYTGKMPPPIQPGRGNPYCLFLCYEGHVHYTGKMPWSRGHVLRSLTYVRILKGVSPEIFQESEVITVERSFFKMCR